MRPDGTSWGCRRLGVRYGATVALEEVSFQVARGVMVRGAPFEALILPLGMLAVLGTVVFGLSIARFRRDLAPTGRGHGADAADVDQDQAARARAGAR